MDRSTNGRGRPPTASVEAAPPVVPPASPEREARNRVARRDEAAASEARDRYRDHGVEPLEPDEGIRWLLGPGEQVLAVRRSVALDRTQSSADSGAADPIEGDLYVTSRRLVHVGRRLRTVDLDDIEDAELAGGRVLLLLRDGVGIALRAERPRLLRVQVATARAARAGLAGRRRGRPQAGSR